MDFDSQEADSSEKNAFIQIIQYLSTHWNREFWLSRAILEESKKTEHLSLAFDSILQFDYIMKNEFMESYKLSDYNQNKISNLFWNFCYEYLRYSNC